MRAAAATTARLRATTRPTGWGLRGRSAFMAVLYRLPPRRPPAVDRPHPNMSPNGGFVKDRRCSGRRRAQFRAARRPTTGRRWRVSAATPRRCRRLFRRPLPDRPVVELDGHAVGRIDRAHVRPGNPDPARIVEPCARCQTGIVDHVELPAVLRDVGELARPGRIATPDAAIWTGQIDPLRRSVGCDQSCRYGNRTQYYSHRFALLTR